MASDEFRPHTGMVTGSIVIGLAVLLIAGWFLDRTEIPSPLAAAALLSAVLVASATLWPRLRFDDETLEMRNQFETVHIPLAAIEEVSLRSVLAVGVDGRRFVSPVLGKGRRDLVRHIRPGWGESIASSTGGGAPRMDYNDYVEELLRQRIDDARTARGITRGSAEAVALAADVRREPAWPIIAATAVAVVLLVLAILL